MQRQLFAPHDGRTRDARGFGLRCGCLHNRFDANGPGGPDVLPLLAPGHPTSGFMNLCSGVPGPAPSCP